MMSRGETRGERRRPRRSASSEPHLRPATIEDGLRRHNEALEDAYATVTMYLRRALRSASSGERRLIEADLPREPAIIRVGGLPDED